MGYKVSEDVMKAKDVAKLESKQYRQALRNKDRYPIELAEETLKLLKALK